MGTLALPPLRTPEEYLELDRNSEFKHEYLDGAVIEMSGGTINHSTIRTNTSGLLWRALDGSSCEVHSDVRVSPPGGRTYCFPDVFVICGKPRFKGDRSDTVENPVLIVEVLSNSTSDYDQGVKFRRYRSIPELRQYVLFAQDEPYVMVYSKTEQGFWLLAEYSGLDKTIHLDSVDITLPLTAVYRGVEFPAAAAD